MKCYPWYGLSSTGNTWMSSGNLSNAAQPKRRSRPFWWKLSISCQSNKILIILLNITLTDSVFAVGPLSVTILGPDSARVGTSVSLRCTAESWPDCDFYWFFNNQSSVFKNGPVVTFSVTKESEGDYKCEARNPVTNITLYQTKAFTVGE